jgi:hypothetical protein
MKISCSKSKIMALLGQHPTQSKIVVEKKILEQVNTFNYLGCNLSHESKKDLQEKIIKFQKIVGILNNIFKPKEVQKATRLRVYNTLAISAIMNGSETWTLRKQDKHRLTTSEMKFFRTARYRVMDHTKNEQIIQELHKTLILERIKNARKIGDSMFQEWILIDYLRKFYNTILKEKGE